MYALLKKILFRLDPELAHDISLRGINLANSLGLMPLFSYKVADDSIEVMGLHFKNRVGLAAGLDKNGDYFNALGKLGFGFIEIGTITPIPQPGNPKKRLFRLKDEEAIINRMGFNNKGLQYLMRNAMARKYEGVLGINIGKNKNTPEDKALSDYQICMEGVYPYADYITVNVSSPNTPGLRDLQFGESFNHLLKGIKSKQAELYNQYQKYVPVAVKIAPDMSNEELEGIAKCLIEHRIDGVIATNTTIGREGVENSIFQKEAGGLSGRPVKDKSTETIRQLSRFLSGKLPIIGVGGIVDGKDAAEKIQAGASLVQIYSGFIFSGPKLIADSSQTIKMLT